MEKEHNDLPNKDIKVIVGVIVGMPKLVQTIGDKKD